MVLLMLAPADLPVTGTGEGAVKVLATDRPEVLMTTGAPMVALGVTGTAMAEVLVLALATTTGEVIMVVAGEVTDTVPPGMMIGDLLPEETGTATAEALALATTIGEQVMVEAEEDQVMIGDLPIGDLPIGGRRPIMPRPVTVIVRDTNEAQPLTRALHSCRTRNPTPHQLHL